MLAVEYDGEHHRADPAVFAYDIKRSEDLDELGWIDDPRCGSTPRRGRYTPARAARGTRGRIETALRALATHTFRPEHRVNDRIRAHSTAQRES